MYEYTINVDGFTFNGVDYPAAHLVIDVPTYVGNVDSEATLAPVTYDGFTFNNIGIGVIANPGGMGIYAGSGIVDPATQPFGSIIGLGMPLIDVHQWNGFDPIAGNFSIEFARDCATCGTTVALSQGTISGIDPPDPTSVLEPATGGLMLLGIACAWLLPRRYNPLHALYRPHRAQT